MAPKAIRKNGSKADSIAINELKQGMINGESNHSNILTFSISRSKNSGASYPHQKSPLWLLIPQHLPRQKFPSSECGR